MSWVAGRQQRVNKLVGTGSLRPTPLKPLNNYEPPDSEIHEPLLHLQVESKDVNTVEDSEPKYVVSNKNKKRNGASTTNLRAFMQTQLENTVLIKVL